MVTNTPKSRTVHVLRGGQITIPIEFRRALGIEEGSLVQVTFAEPGTLTLSAVEATPKGSAYLRELYEAFAPVRQEAIDKGYTEDEINEWIDQAIREVRTERKNSQG
ncbi:MAG: AbrB/MazE/SpoVT family DNA-binding domain-containing protein [Thermomicrobiales bacterium]|nr:AbrB/MazE/SpoVT family DNA-binding domain-containing protein [Thermomicrobiales bacterium]